MLVKQVWQLMQAPNSLRIRVLRAKYLEDADVLNAKPMPGMSY
jgi:hypothetical protein